ncbi:unknown protein [Paenibacillus amylolyticus]|uniref:Uncharacterized protein n=1 Tax=Paenibacillus amylolyticus TaxID=1451 RepID=A0A100VKL0_PAEAM|nr:unknown protein [Paenibacillus amylolyticus]
MSALTHVVFHVKFSVLNFELSKGDRVMTELEVVDVYVDLSTNMNSGMVHNITNQNPTRYPVYA